MLPSSINKQYLPQCVETVVFCAMASLQQKLYKFFHASAPVQRALNGKAAADGPDLQALPAITALKKAGGGNGGERWPSYILAPYGQSWNKGLAREPCAAQGRWAEIAKSVSCLQLFVIP